MPKATHPSREELNAYSLGQLPEEKAVAIDSHISECRTCCETIVDISSHDTFVGLLKDARQSQTDQTVDHGEPVASSQEVPTPLVQHPRYEIVELIGKGGMGDVYKARHRMMDRTVALKIINRNYVRKPEAVERFHREVKTAAQLSHPNIVTAFDAEQAGEIHFLVMEFVNGTDLAHVVKERGPLPITDACNYIQQAAIGLQHAHECSMVHRDIKPHNLMVTLDGTVKILDFGLASLGPVATKDPENVETRGDLTAAGAIMGTPDFISPEQAGDARQADIRSDIYSLGTTLYFLLSGQPPFVEGSVLEKLKSHAQSEPKPLESIREDIPVELLAIVKRMIAKDPEQRFQTPAEVAEALKTFNKTTQPSSKQEQPPVKPVRNLTRFIALAALTTVFIATLAGGFIYTSNFIFKQQPNDPFMIGGGSAVGGSAIDGSNWNFLSGSLYLQRDEPGVLFGICEKPDGGSEFSYVVLFRHNASDQSSITRPKKSGMAFDGRRASLKDGITIDGKGIELDAEILLKGNRIESTIMSIDGNAIDPAKGRLILVDLTSESVTYSQAQADFLDDIPSLKSLTNDTDEVAKLALQLTHFDAVREFLAASETAADGPPATKLTSDQIVRALSDKHGKLTPKLQKTFSKAAGIPNAQWQKFSTNPAAEANAIKGEPLSLILWNLNPLQEATKNLMVLEDFKYIGSIPQPSQLSDAMFPSNVDGYHSMLQTEYISGLTYEVNSGPLDKAKLRGNFRFQAPKLYSGKINFVVSVDADANLEVTEFSLPNYGITIIRGENGLWNRAKATTKTSSVDN